MSLEILERSADTERLLQDTRQLALTLQENEKSLQEGEEQMRRLLDLSPVGCTIIKLPSGKSTFVNRRLSFLLGYSVEEMQALSVADYWPDAAERAVFDAELVATRRVDRCRAHFKRSDGALVLLLLSASFEQVFGSKHLVNWGYDITALNEAEEGMRIAIAEQSAMFEATTLGIAFVKDRVIARSNRKLDALFGVFEGALIGTSTRSWYATEADFEAGGSAVYEKIAHGEIHQREQELVRSDGSRFWCLLSGAAIDTGDLQKGTVWMLQDITGRKQAEAALAQRVNELERFNRLTIDREEKMIELKQEINTLLGQGGSAPKYRIVE
jgi:PAS domain S-box-containing protein